MAIANETYVSFCNHFNQPRHIIWLPNRNESHAGMSLPTAVRRVQDLATSRESKAHFGLPRVRPWDNRGKRYMDRKRIQCLSNASQHVPRSLPPIRLRSLGSVVSSPCGVRGRAPMQNEFGAF